MMSAMTLRGLDETTVERLKQEARRRGISVNALLRDMVRHGLGLDSAAQRVRHMDLDALAGTWAAADASEFNAATEAFERVDESLWR
jgi:plasmid stability protein